MKRILLFIILGFFALQTRAQNQHTSDTTQHKSQPSKADPNAEIDIDDPPKSPAPATTDPNVVYAAVEKEPAYRGGNTALIAYFTKNFQNPTNDHGRIIATFVIEKDGSLNGIKILRSPSNVAADEAIRVLKLCPKWNPGMQNGHAVRVQYTISMPI